MVGVGWPRKTIDAAVLAAPVGVHRTVEADVWRVVAGQDRFGPLDRHRRPALRDSVKRFDLVEPFSLDHSLLEVEARGGGVAGCPASTARFDRHSVLIRRSGEHNKNTAGRWRYLSPPWPVDEESP